jgi:flagellar FliL protein
MSKKELTASKDDKGPGHVSDSAGADGEGKPKKKSRLMLLVIPLVLLLVAGGGGFLVFAGIVKVPFLSHPKKQKAVVAQMQFIKMPELVANLDAGANDSYAKMQAELEVPDAVSATVVNTQMPAIVDLFQSYLRTMQPADLQGAEGLYRLREALLARANVIVAPSTVQDVLFIELIVQ